LLGIVLNPPVDIPKPVESDIYEPLDILGTDTFAVCFRDGKGGECAEAFPQDGPARVRVPSEVTTAADIL